MNPWVASVVAIVAVAAVAPAPSAVSVSTARTMDPPRLVQWSQVGDIALGERRAQLEREYGGPGHGYHSRFGYYRLHGSRVYVYFRDGRVNEIEFTTRYYRTQAGFGIGSPIPLGPCHRTASNRCERRWHGFIWNPTLRERPCGCWVKVGRGTQSLRISTANYLEPWTIIETGFTGRSTDIYMAQKYVD